MYQLLRIATLGLLAWFVLARFRKPILGAPVVGDRVRTHQRGDRLVDSGTAGNNGQALPP